MSPPPTYPSYSPAQISSCVILPKNGWWGCSNGHIPCVHLSVLNISTDFNILVQLVPSLVYHLYEEMLDRWDWDYHTKQEPITTLTVSLLLGLVAARVVTGTTRQKLPRAQGCHRLRHREDRRINHPPSRVPNLPLWSSPTEPLWSRFTLFTAERAFHRPKGRVLLLSWPLRHG